MRKPAESGIITDGVYMSSLGSQTLLHYVANRIKLSSRSADINRRGFHIFRVPSGKRRKTLNRRHSAIGSEIRIKYLSPEEFDEALK